VNSGDAGKGAAELPIYPSQVKIKFKFITDPHVCTALRIFRTSTHPQASTLHYPQATKLSNLQQPERSSPPSSGEALHPQAAKLSTLKRRSSPSSSGDVPLPSSGDIPLPSSGEALQPQAATFHYPQAAKLSILKRRRSTTLKRRSSPPSSGEALHPQAATLHYPQAAKLSKPKRRESSEKLGPKDEAMWMQPGIMQTVQVAVPASKRQLVAMLPCQS
jgi:hypothetical protein